MVKKTIILFLYLLPIIFIFKNWFILPFISGHDFPYFFRETLAEYSFFPPVWNPIGMGQETINYGLGIFIYFIVSVFVNTFNLPWELVYKVFIFGLFLFLSVFSSRFLLCKVLERPTSLQFLLSTFIFTANTYILMVVDGGQVGVFLAYSIAPFALGRFIYLISCFDQLSQNIKYQISNIKYSIITGLILSFQVMFDIRIAFVTVGISLFYAIYHYFFIKRFDIKLFTFHFSLFTFVVLGLHASWLLPIIIFRFHPAIEIVSSFGSVENLRFFSFATFSQTLSLLSPNWPENIFGKVYFMRPEFILLPILAFCGLLFLSSKALKNAEQYAERRRILFFGFLGIIGAFLAKGANEPFGFLNQWMFLHIPGMSMFRDPTKFYLLIALSYLVLMPFSISCISKWINEKIKMKNEKLHIKLKKKYFIFALSFLFFIFYFLFLIRPVFLNQLSGTFARHEIPQEYIKLKNFLYNQTTFSRTLWAPTQQRYNFYSNIHPAVSADSIFSATNSAETVRKLQEEKARELLSNLSIQYVIIPYDSFGEIFVEDRKYNEGEYLEMIKVLARIEWLKKISGFGKIAVYEMPNYKDHFWLDGFGSLSYTQVSPSNYRVKVSIDKASNLIFTDSYSPQWVANVEGKEIKSEMAKYNLNSFHLEKTGKYNLTISFSKEKFYIYGIIISLIFIALLLFVLMYNKKKFKP